ncbi:6,7-dimethyl-8-ribityllumazine synthase [Terasakiella brassicae]|uniref:6,7-dimethyl-8-ribityllumazine synthase n=1 Tax=Terasakiella brassicae TaxID=1634917 RepID=A0A917C437_9PROT|nr:6,7-dimethyl-8-ribityllumazine synthase [Terasakiella brassicae]GGF70806.1 6,7-dimethyl-8-ribityllumazine synthase [Terasakiella brassicae]
METPRIFVAEARFYDDIADALYASVEKEFEGKGYELKRYQVPGVFELPSAFSYAIRAMEMGAAGARYTGFISLGCVIRGETTHYDVVVDETSRALMDLSVKHNLAHGFGMITCENRDQALARAYRDQKDVGGKAARACLKMIELKKQLHLLPR